MRIIENRFLPPKCYAAMSLFGFLLTRDKRQVNETTMRHEYIHCVQQQETLIVFFFLWYAVEYLVRLCRYRNHDRAYRSISFEREAYRHGQDLRYLDRRGFWRWLRYL